MNNGTLNSIHSPFRFAGGKYYARKLILTHIPEHSVYIEPFAGGGSIFFAKSKVEKNWLNDKDADLVNVYEHIRDSVEGIVELLKGHRASKLKHGYFKNEFEPKNDLERAFRWYYLNRTSYSGIMNHPNCYWGYGKKFSMGPLRWPPHLRNCSTKLQNVRLSNWDFEAVLNNAPDGAFLFVDPPYFNADQDKFYPVSFSKDDHIRLAKALKKHSKRVKFLLTYDNTPEIRELYYWAHEVLDKEWNYTIFRTDDQSKNGNGKNGRHKNGKGKRYKGQELFILNYEVPAFPVLEQLALPLNGSKASNGGHQRARRKEYAE